MSPAAEVIARPELPQVFGRYLLLKRLSRGGMGEIFLAKLGEIQGFEKLVIIKKVLPNLVADEEFIKRFIDEAQVAIKLNHANIAPVFEVGKVDGEYFLAIEYVEGRDLRRLIARQREEKTRLPPDLCLYLVRELANGLAYAHRRTDNDGRSLAVVHCDISPPNVMVSFEGEVKIIDFGIAKSALRIAGTNPNLGFGKFGYMAPEQLVRGGVVDRRTDIYAAGVVLYELLSGERLFQFPEGADYKQIARMVAGGKYVSLGKRDPTLDPGLEPVVMKALATRPADRYQTGEEFRDALQGKLSQMNPTLSSDALAHYLRHLFADEITEEHQLVERMKAVDVAPFREELTAATSEHTVTYARAGGMFSRRLGRSLTPPATPVAPSADRTDREMRVGARLAGLPLLIGGGLVALAAGGGLMLWVMQRRPAKPAMALPQSVVAVKVPSLPPPSPHPPSLTPTSGLLASPGPSPAVKPASPSAPLEAAPSPSPSASAASVHHDHHHRPPAVHATDAPPPPQHRLADSVLAKYSAVKKEYAAFKSQYGSQLEEKWSAIAFENTFDKGEGKLDKLDGMLDALRREMARARQ